MSKSKGRRQSRLSRCARAPMRLLCRVRDLYVRSLMSCAGNMRYGGYTDLPIVSMSPLPRSFSVSSSRSSATDEDFRELMRVASKRALQNKYGTASPQQQRLCSPASMAAATPKGMRMMPRSLSHSVGIARIDEDSPCDFAEDNNSLNTTNIFYSRSRSCAAARKRPAFSGHYF